eukprot:TRINITY_DN1298_c0_g1_i1.p2 TRINITY_DN1298_c0_g1~~TRINITY_DN1298_c0_g1_i1.p2  ORF type:complete len:277 (-),score=42.45 TRINITY_DN1298_c0_g1_i1:1030-1860(-)
MYFALRVDQALISALALTVTFVGSLYLWGIHRKRDDPTTIKLRFISSILTCVVAFFLAKSWCIDDGQEPTFAHWLGFHSSGLLLASVVPLLLTMVWFAGPLLQAVLNDRDNLIPDASLQTIRAVVMAPICEEFVFRSCMLPLMFHAGFNVWVIVLVCPWFFGVAHFHHLLQFRLRDKSEQTPIAYQQALQSSVGQMLFTTLFGMYTAFLFVRTGHFLAPCLVHAFCNQMGVPQFDNAFNGPHKKYLKPTYVIGVTLFLLFLFPATTPEWYHSLYFQ